jgi:DNA-binding MurR/RpiR family transcriptional regulator
VSGSGSTPTSLLYAQQASRLGGRVCCLTAIPDSPIGVLSRPCLHVPTEGTAQFGQVLFTQVAMLLFDGMVLDLGGRDFVIQRGNHANLQ